MRDSVKYYVYLLLAGKGRRVQSCGSINAKTTFFIDEECNLSTFFYNKIEKNLCCIEIKKECLFFTIYRLLPGVLCAGHWDFKNIYSSIVVHLCDIMWERPI